MSSISPMIGVFVDKNSASLLSYSSNGEPLNL